MLIYQRLVDSVKIEMRKNKPLLKNHSASLILIGIGRSAYVFRMADSHKAIKVFFPTHTHFAYEEALAYQIVKEIEYFPNMYEYGSNYIVIDYIEGNTFFECLTQGRQISKSKIKEVDTAITLAQDLGLNPADIHLRNIIISEQNEVKLIDIARFRQTGHCPQWNDLKAALNRLYSKPFFPKKFPTPMLNLIAYFYKKYLYRPHTDIYVKKRFHNTL